MHFKSQKLSNIKFFQIVRKLQKQNVKIPKNINYSFINQEI